MPTATLLLRERNAVSLTSIVERALQRKPPLLEYELQLTSTQLDFILNTKTNVNNSNNDENEKLLQKNSLDEGFESDIDSISIVSCDETDLVVAEKKDKQIQETDSANGSACSDTDDNDPTITNATRIGNETFNLVDCSCYTDIRAPEILLFVIKNDTYVFKLDHVKLQRFYANFSALKAVANQKTYNNNGRNVGAKFNLLQRTDCNGVTHIEISRDHRDNGSCKNVNEPPSSIISINTPEDNVQSAFNSLKLNKKIWNSSDDLLLDYPTKPDRRKKTKAKAPLPPPNNINNNNNATASPVNVVKSHFPQEFNAKLTTYQQFTGNDSPKKFQESMTLNRKKLVLDSWTSSVPRLLLKKQRSKSETRNFTPMAYRYIDTTQTVKETKSKPKQIQTPLYLPKVPTYDIDYTTLKKKNQRYSNEQATTTISNRLFGMSSKLRDFSALIDTNNGNSDRDLVMPNKGLLSSGKWSSLGELSYKLNNTGGDGSLKSVIKKDENKRKNNEKKVTFSAYTTVQVV